MKPHFEFREEYGRKGKFLLIWNFPHTNTIIHETSTFSPLIEEQKPEDKRHPKYHTKSFSYLVAVVKPTNWVSEIAEYIKNELQGIDCTESQSAQIKAYLRGGFKLYREELIELFPLEYNEYLSELEN